MKMYIELIKQVLQNKGKIISWENLTTKFIMNSKATYDNLLECDLYFKGNLPGDYKYFLTVFDGGDLFNYDDVGGFTFFSSKRLIQENKFLKESYEKADSKEFWDYNVILFSTVIGGDADYLGFRIKENEKYDILDISLYERPSQWRVIDNSFDNFVEKFIQEKGKAYWLF